MTIPEMVLVLARAKQALADFERDNSKIIMQHETLKNAVKKADDELRFEALMNFTELGDIKPHDAVDVRIVRSEVFNSDENKKVAAAEHPEVLDVDTDYVAAHAFEIIPMLYAQHPGAVRVNERKAAALQKQTECFVPSTQEKPTVFVKKALGEYLFVPRSDEEELL